MSIKFEKLKPGMTVYDNGHQLGPLGRRPATWEVRIDEVNVTAEQVLARWNVCNPARWYSKRQAQKWSAKPRKVRP